MSQGQANTDATTASQRVDLREATEPHPHARAILTAAVAPGGAPSHAYLFHGPAGTGKRAAARAFAAALLADGEGSTDAGTQASAAGRASAAERVWRGTHPDLTWVVPSGASELLVSDIDEAVVAAATRTPFESARRVFVIERAGAMNDQAANRLLKTLEEPASFAHLILLAEHTEDVLATIASRCQPVRFDPLAGEAVEQRLRERLGEGIAPLALAACARLCAGDALLGERLAGEEGTVLRRCAERLASDSLAGRTEERPWRALIDLAKRAGEAAGEQVGERLRAEAEMLPSKERRRYEREGADAVRRAERRERAATLDLGLRLVELWLRDAWCVAVGAPELLLAVDRREELEALGKAHAPVALQRAVELVAETRMRLALNVSEELAVEALAYALQAEGA